MSAAEAKGGILVFLPGVQEIRQCIDSLQASPSASEAKILPLHANLSSDEQRAVFVPSQKWKIIVATNVAEVLTRTVLLHCILILDHSPTQTSITIDDVVYVIDTGKVKEMQYDPESGFTKLVEQWTTQAAGRQRRGRAGRTRPGVCYKLYTRVRERKMEKFPRPEILRVPLESICLIVKATREHEDVKVWNLELVIATSSHIPLVSNSCVVPSTHQKSRLWKRRSQFLRNSALSTRTAV
jgi:HrpA-like RNA helicase